MLASLPWFLLFYTSSGLCPDYSGDAYTIGGLFTASDALTSSYLSDTAMWGAEVVNMLNLLSPGSTLTLSPAASLVNSTTTGNAGFWTSAGVLAVIDASNNNLTAALATSLGSTTVSQVVSVSDLVQFSNATQFPSLLQVFPQAPAQARAFVAVMSYFGWRRAALVCSSDPNYVSVAASLRTRLADEGFTAINTPQWPSGANATVIAASLSVAAARYARVFIIMASASDTETVLEAAYASRLYGDGYVYMTTEDFGMGGKAQIKTSAALTVATGALILQASSGSATFDQQLFPEMFSNRFPDRKQPFAAPWVFDSVLAVGYAIQSVQQRCLPVNTTTVGAALRSVSFSGSTGWILFTPQSNARPDGVYSVLNVQSLTVARSLGTVGYSQTSPTEQTFANYITVATAVWNGRRGTTPPSCVHYTIGGSFTFANADSFNSISSAQMGFDEINANNLLGDGDVIEMPSEFIFDDNCDPVQGVVAATNLSNSITEEGGPPFGVTGLGCSAVTQGAYPIYSQANIVAIAYSASDLFANPANFPMFVRIIPSSGTAATALLAVMQFYGFRQIACFGTNEAYGASAVQAIVSKAPAFGIKVTVSALWTPRSSTAVVQQMLAPLVTTGTRIVCVYAHYDDNVVFFEAVYNMNLFGANYFYMPTATITGALVDPNASPQFLQAAAGSVALANRASSLIAQQYLNNYQARFNRTPLDQDPFMYDAAYAFAHGIRAMKQQGLEPPFVPTDFLDQVRNLVFQGATGTISYPDAPSVLGNNRLGATWALLNVHTGHFDTVPVNNAAYDIPGQPFYVEGNVTFFNDGLYPPRSCPHGSSSSFATKPPPWGGQIVQTCTLCLEGTYAVSGSPICNPCPTGQLCPFAARAPLQPLPNTGLVYSQPVSVGAVTPNDVLSRLAYYYLGIGGGVLFIMFIILGVLRYCCKKCGRGVKSTVQKWDVMFIEKHSFEEIGESTIKRQTAIGGIFTVTFFLLALIVVGYLVHRFVENRYTVNQSTEAGTANFTNPVGLTINVQIIGDNLPELCNANSMSSTFPGGTFTAQTSADGASCTAAFAIPQRDGLLPVSMTVTFAFPGHRAYAFAWSLSSKPIGSAPATSVSGYTVADPGGVLTGTNATTIEVGLQPQRYLNMNLLNSEDQASTCGYFPIITSQTVGSQATNGSYWNAPPGLFLSFSCTRSSLVQVLSVDQTESPVNLITQIVSFLSAVLSFCGLALLVVETVFRRAKLSYDDRKKRRASKKLDAPLEVFQGADADVAVPSSLAEDEEDVYVDEMVMGRDIDNIMLERQRNLLQRLHTVELNAPRHFNSHLEDA